MTRFTFKWLLVFVLLSGSASATKATVAERSQNTAPNSTISNGQLFVDSVLAAKTANAISAELPSIQQKQGEAASRKKELEMDAQLEKSITTGNLVADAFLDELHPQLKSFFRHSLMHGQVKYLEGRRESDLAKQALAIEAMIAWGEFWTKNNAKIIAKLDVASGPPQKASFWKFALIQLVADFICLLVYSFALVALFAPMAVVAKFVKNETALKFFVIPFCVVSYSSQLYFWGLWAAFLSELTIKYSGMPGVSHHWIYFVFAFMGSIGPIGFLAFKSEQSSQSAEEYSSLQNQTIIHGTFAAVAFIVFCLWPGLSAWPFGWALKFLV